MFDVTLGYLFCRVTINVDALNVESFKITRSGGTWWKGVCALRCRQKRETKYCNKRKSDCLMKFCRRVFLSTRSSKDDSIFVELASSSLSLSLPPLQYFLAAPRAERKRGRVVCSEFNLWALLFTSSHLQKKMGFYLMDSSYRERSTRNMSLLRNSKLELEEDWWGTGGWFQV